MPAHMIPPLPKEYDEKSEEGLVFKALKKLPDDYYVFHSVVINEVKNWKLIEREIDFVVVNQKKGILCIEAKNGKNIRYYDREWHYSNGDLMKHDGPYNQVATASKTLRNKLKDHPNKSIHELAFKCKIYYAVWFFGMSRETFEIKNQQGLPEDAPIDLTMFLEDLTDPTDSINKIFSIAIPIDDEKNAKTDISNEEFQLLLDSALCPEFNLIPSPRAKNILIEEQMNQLLYEQYRLLDFLEDQNCAVINGAAGTGKTMLAIEKARRNSIEEEKVLFLCYNRMLCKYLNDTYKTSENKGFRRSFKNVDFMTISSLAKEKTGNYKDYDGLLEWLIRCYDDPTKFGYKHVIIDEGQDFGIIDVLNEQSEAEKNCSIIDTLQDVVLEGEGTFYLFYDKYQMIQGGGNIKYKLPDCINNSDCRLSLHYNCRNTKEIAQTSVTPLRDNRNRAIIPKTACTWYEPITPVMHLVGSDNKAVKALGKILTKYEEAKLENIVILYPGKLEYCCIADNLVPEDTTGNSYYLYEFGGKKYKVTTCIKFKGLEADAVVILGLDKNSFIGEKGLEFYVGASRAKQYLDFIAQITPQEYGEVIKMLDTNAPVKNDPEKMRKVLKGVFSAEVELN